MRLAIWLSSVRAHTLVDISLRQEHGDLLHALEVHATQKDRLSKGVLGPLIGVVRTIPSWVKIKSDLRSIKFMLGNLEKVSA